MEYIKLKNSDLKVSRVCMGGCAMGGHGWGVVSEQDLINAIEKALDIGINFFDTADTYGLGKSEETLGKVIKGQRDKAIIATKFGVRVENGKTYYDNSPKWINIAIENSLRRLGTDYIDLYQIHYRDCVTPLDDVVETLEKLKNKGYIRQYGLSNILSNDIKELKKYKGKFISFQDEYSLANRDYESDIVKISDDLDITALTWGSLGQGILTGKYDLNCKFGSDDRRSREIYKNFHGDKLTHNIKIVEVLKQIAFEVEKTPAAVAIRWILDYLNESVVIAGVKNSNQLMSNASALGWKLEPKYIEELNKVSKIKNIK